MKNTLKLLTSASKTNHPIKITDPILNVTNHVNFTKVSKEVISHFHAGANKVVLPIRSIEINTDVTFINNKGVIKIYGDCRAIRNCAPDYDSMHEFLNKGFSAAFFETKIEYIEVDEPLGNLADYE